jgi:hypothetical protein
MGDEQAMSIKTLYRFAHKQFIVDTIVDIYRNSTNCFLNILFIMIPIWIIYIISIKSCYSYLNKFPISPPVASLHRLTILSLYRCLYTKYIWIAYNIAYKGSLYFCIPGV